MDEKTRELRDIFMDVSEEGTVTERQQEGRGSLATDREGVDRRLREVIERLRERFGLETALDDEALVTVVRAYFEGEDDERIAESVGSDAETVLLARLDLHLFREADAEGVPTDAIREFPPAERTAERIAEALDVDAATAERYRRVVAARENARRVSHRFRAEYEDVLADAGLATRMTESVHEDGLEEATEDIDSLESDAAVDF
ncbi:MAG: conditioned medium-induced protein 4 [Haloarculaceae archaeon]